MQIDKRLHRPVRLNVFSYGTQGCPPLRETLDLRSDRRRVVDQEVSRPAKRIVRIRDVRGRAGPGVLTSEAAPKESGKAVLAGPTAVTCLMQYVASDSLADNFSASAAAAARAASAATVAAVATISARGTILRRVMTTAGHQSGEAPAARRASS